MRSIAERDKSKRKDGTFSREDFTWDATRNLYICPAGKLLKTTGRVQKHDRHRYCARTRDCTSCPLKPRCCPTQPFRRVERDVNEAARDVARAILKTPEYEQSCRERKKVEMLFAHLKRIFGLGRLRLRGPCGANDEFLLAATAQNLKKLAKLRPMPPPEPLPA